LIADIFIILLLTFLFHITFDLLMLRDFAFQLSLFHDISLSPAIRLILISCFLLYRRFAISSIFLISPL